MVPHGWQHYEAEQFGRRQKSSRVSHQKSTSVITALTHVGGNQYSMGGKEAWVEIMLHIILCPTCLRACHPHLKLHLE